MLAAAHPIGFRKAREILRRHRVDQREIVSFGQRVRDRGKCGVADSIDSAVEMMRPGITPRVQKLVDGCESGDCTPGKP
jgi:hypothetical protein